MLKSPCGEVERSQSEIPRFPEQNVALEKLNLTSHEELGARFDIDFFVEFLRSESAFKLCHLMAAGPP